MKFLVEVITGSGTTDQREVEARTAREAEDQVRLRGLYPIRVIETQTAKQAAEAKKTKGGLFDNIFKISSQERILFTQKLATFLKAGLPILPALEILRDQSPKGPLRARLVSISDDISAGNTFAESLAKFPRDFSNFYIASIRAGEAGGQLPEILQQLADYMNVIQTRKRKAITASLYPAILVIAVVSVVFLVSIKYIPMVENFLKTMHVPLPGLTRTVLEVNQFMLGHLFLLFILPFIVVGTYLFLVRRFAPVRKVVHKFWLKAPATGWLIRTSNFAWIFRTFGMLAFSGVPILQAMQITSQVIRNDIIREELDRIREEVAKGEPISKTMQKGGLFDRFAVTMLDVGERSGELDVMMTRVADFYDQELDEFYLRVERLAPAIMTLVMAGLVGTVVVALYLPILTVIDTMANSKRL